MWGRSYFAETQWRAASLAPAGLAALSPGISAGANANNGSLYRGGAYELGSRLSWGHASISANELLREFADDPERQGKEFQSWLDLDRSFSDGSAFGTLPLRDLSRTARHIHEPPCPALGRRIAGEQLHAPVGRSIQQAGAMPTLHIGGWFDIFCPEHPLPVRDAARAQPNRGRTRAPAYRRARGPTRTSPAATRMCSFGLNAAGGMMNGLGDLSGLQTAWFDAVLKGEPERLRQVPPVLLYFMGENQWRGFDELPSPRSHRSWFLGADGIAAGHAGIRRFRRATTTTPWTRSPPRAAPP